MWLSKQNNKRLSDKLLQSTEFSKFVGNKVKIQNLILNSDKHLEYIKEIRLPGVFSTDLQIVNLKFIQKSKKPRQARTIVKNKAVGIAEPHIKFYLKAKVIKHLVLEQRGQISQLHRMESLEKVHTYGETWLMSEVTLQILGWEGK